MKFNRYMIKHNRSFKVESLTQFLCFLVHADSDEARVKCTSTLYKYINVSLSCLKILQLIHSEITFSYACVGLVTQSSCDMLIYAQSFLPNVLY